MYIAVACGGTGGHVFPGLATAGVLRKRNVEVSLWLAGRDVENASIENWDGAVVRVKAEGFSADTSFRSIGVAAGLLAGVFRCRRLMKGNPPDALLAMGSYASVGPVIAAWSLGIPVVLHEANAVPGRAVSFLSHFAQAVGVTFASASKYLRNKQVVMTGLPARETRDAKFEEGPLRKDVFTVLVMGGSQGAHRLNELTTAGLCLLHGAGIPIQVIHLSGMKDEAMVKEAYDGRGVPSLVLGFLKDMDKAYNAADIAISRAGAGACVELATRGIPALLVPLPSARRDHQMMNARELAAAGGADLADESTLTPEWLAEYVGKCVADPGRLDRMGKAIKNVAIPDAAQRLADLVIKQVKK